jgi:hypothetical protein
MMLSNLTSVLLVGCELCIRGIRTVKDKCFYVSTLSFYATNGYDVEIVYDIIFCRAEQR